ncbi:MAG TPA: BamA/TamA family outer membrane protein [Candidatus Binatia bacterium]|nr:BamA/TamA family outer membrane protein [Candidatus Binatia bacterium]
MVSVSLPARAADDRPEVAIRARLDFEAPEITGAAEVHWRNSGVVPVRTLRVFLFANRFRSDDSLNDLARHFLIAGKTFRSGGTDLVSVTEARGPLSWRFEDVPSLPPKTVAAFDLGREVSPGEEIVVTIAFRTRLPNLFDTFGAVDGLVVADGGWYPLPLAVVPMPGNHLCASSVGTRAELSIPAGSSLLVNGRRFAAGSDIEVAAPAGERLSLVLSRTPFETSAFRVGRRTVEIDSVPSRELAHRISRGKTPLEALADTLPAVLADSSDERPLRIVRLPLRWYPSASVPGMVLVSDRLFEIFPILRPLHQRELAYAVFLEEETKAAAAREPPVDASWIAEGLAWRRAEALYRARFRGGREVKDWIRLFDVFAIVDRFETAPRIPFVRPFFPVAASDDPLGIRLGGVCGDRPPGGFVFDKLEAKLRPATFAAVLERYRGSRDHLRDVVRAAGGEDADRFLAAWLRRYAPVNYALREVELDPAGKPGARFTIDRTSPEVRPDSVDVALEEEGDAGTETSFIDLSGASTVVDLAARAKVRAVELDPRRETVQTRLDDDRVPSEYQFLLDSADVEVSSTEFGFSTLLVGRRRYDYRKDLALAGFYTSRGYGVDAGFQLHGGKPIDPNLYRQNLFAYYSLEELDSSFENKQSPDVRTRGRLGGFGLRFNWYDAFWFENPAGSHHLRLFFDGYGRSLGGDFNFVQGGGSLVYTLPLRVDTILAAQLLNGYSATTGNGPIPNQGLFSLGGFRSIRGIGAEDELAKDIVVVRAELRHMLPWQLDWNFEDVLIARRLQAKVFVDTGRVDDSSRQLFDPSGFAVGVGGGLNLFYDFMGFYPTTFYLDIATRADKAGSAQVLFGVGQPF